MQLQHFANFVLFLKCTIHSKHDSVRNLFKTNKVFQRVTPHPPNVSSSRSFTLFPIVLLSPMLNKRRLPRAGLFSPAKKSQRLGPKSCNLHETVVLHTQVRLQNSNICICLADGYKLCSLSKASLDERKAGLS